jgi:hypothetical protein
MNIKYSDEAIGHISWISVVQFISLLDQLSELI